MDRTAKFTIVTPSFNQGPYIEETIKSVIGQKGPFEIEYFIIDGGSSDGSADIIRRYAEAVNSSRYPIHCSRVQIQWRSEKDGGQSAAINEGLKQATGDYASYINSDDLYFDGAFALVTEAFSRRMDADFVFGDGDVIDQSGALQWEWLSRPYDHRVMTSYHFLWNDFTNYIMQQATFWRTRVHKNLGLFDETFHYAMDVEYWVRAGHRGLSLVHIPQKLGKFRMIEGTKSLSGPTVFWSDWLEIFRRYRGADELDSYLAFYYFNLARCSDWDLKTARRVADDSLGRWETLTMDERAAIRLQCERAYGLACYLVAIELQRQGHFERARHYSREGSAHLPRLTIRPATAFCLLKQAAGRRGGPVLDRILDWAVAKYRKNCFDYRYHARVS